MTSEVAVLNKTAVALAADSKMTTGPTGREKTYDTVNKLFTLSKHHPMGIMIYGNAEFMRYPWETIIKIYRQQIGSTSRDTVKDYCEDFLAYLLGDLNFSNDDINRNVADIFAATLFEIRESVMNLILRSGQTGTRQMKNIAAEHLEQHRDYLEQMDDLDYGMRLTKRKIARLYSKQMNDSINHVFEGLATSTTKKLLREGGWLHMGQAKALLLPGAQSVVLAKLHENGCPKKLKRGQHR